MKKFYAISDQEVCEGNIEIIEKEGVYATLENAMKRCWELAETRKAKLEMRLGTVTLKQEKPNEVWIYWNSYGRCSNLYRAVELELK